MPEPLRMAELCAGYGGVFLAAQAAGWPVELAWYAENDEHACKVLAAHHPGVTNVGDITTAQFSACEPVGVLAAGFPCTPISGAGKQLGSADERWLWDDVARAVRVLQPAVFVGENVPRLLTIEDGLLFGGILADLNGLGYTVGWTTVGACKVGLCHHRHRIFIAATREPVELARHPVARWRIGGWETAADTLFGAGALPEWPAAGVASGGRAWEMPSKPCGVTSGVAPLPTPRATRGGSATETTTLLPTPTAADGDRMSAVYCRGNPTLLGSLPPTPTASDHYQGGTTQGNRKSPNLSIAVHHTDNLLPTPTSRDGQSGPGHADSAEGSPDLRTVMSLLPTPRASDSVSGGPNQRSNHGALALKSAVQPGRFGPYEAAVRRHEAVTGTMAPEPTEPAPKGGYRLSPRFVEWMQALPAGHVTDHIGRNPALARLGNGIAIPSGAYALSLLLPDGIRPELAEVSHA